MQITIDIESSTPLYAQLISQVKQAVQKGHKQPGDPLPSIRQLANDLNLNNKTVAKAYRLLERDNVIQARGYRGTYIHPDARENSLVDLNDFVTDKLRSAISTLKESGATDSEIRVAFAAIMNSGDA
jgi:GntR family transcriptional regulator